MRLKIYRGSQEIGGTCIELTSNAGDRLILDVGLPLKPFAEKEILMPVQPAIKGLFRGTDDTNHSVAGLLISHAHLDHYGMIRDVREDIPCFAGEATHRLMQLTSDFTGKKLNIGRPVSFASGISFQHTSFRVTPYLVDHSAVDAYSFLIEADGQKVFYSGDFRGHGRKARLLEWMAQLKIGPVDVLMLEGTMMSRQSTPIWSEEYLEDKITDQLMDEDRLALVCASGQNIDRIVTLLKAARRSNRTLVIDAYNAYVLEALQTIYPTLPRVGSHYRNLKVLYTKFLCRKIRCELNHGDWLDQWNCYRVDLKDVWQSPHRYLFLVRPGIVKDLRRFLKSSDQEALLIFSQWKGCWEQEYMEPLKAWQEEKQMRHIDLHTSGHAIVPDLQRLVAAVQPKTIVPIHTEKPAEYREHFAESITILQDNEDWQIGNLVNS